MIGFVHINKTAGTTIKFILRNSFGIRHCDIKSSIPKSPVFDADFNLARYVFVFGLKSISGHSLVNPAANISHPIDYFTFLRDPIVRYASHYQHIKRAKVRYNKDISLEEFLQNKEMSNLQVRRIAGSEDLDKAKQELADNYFFVGLTEYFSQSVQMLKYFCPYPINPNYKRLHVARDNSEKDKILKDSGTKQLLEENNQLDIALYEFTQKHIYAQQLKSFDLNNKDGLKLPGTYSFPCKYKLARMYNQAIYNSVLRIKSLLQS